MPEPPTATAGAYSVHRARRPVVRPLQQNGTVPCPSVLEGDRRRGVGTALIDRRLGDAAARGATRAVSAVSPEGWQVYQRRGFRSVPARRDVCFYLPSDVA